MIKMLLTITGLACTLCTAAQAETAGVTNYLGTPTTITVSGQNYHLVWSSHPYDYYYKQEYVADGESVEHYRQMIMVEYISQGISVEDAVTSKVNQIEQRQGIDPLSSYSIEKLDTPHHYMVESSLSDIHPPQVNQATAVEWNISRYQPYKNKQGGEGVLLFAFSRQGYDGGIKMLMNDVQAHKSTYLRDFMNTPLPSLNLK